MIGTRRKGMRISTYLTSACLTLLATIALAQSVTYDSELVRASEMSTTSVPTRTG
jgi:hypothetical protein